MTDTNRWTLVAACTLAMLTATAPASAQSRRIERGFVQMQGFTFSWETQLNPPTPPLADGSFFGTFDEVLPNQVHRMLMDRVKRVYFGYTVVVEPQAGLTFRLTFYPLTLTEQLRQRLGDDAAAWKPLPSTKFPAPQTIRSGEVLELNLLSNDNWGQRLTEFMSVQVGPRREGFARLDDTSREFSSAVGAPRDFGVSDVFLRLRDPRVFINGRFEESSARTLGEESGGVVWIYIPTRGRFLLSVIPNPKQGFSRAGEIRGTSLRFTVGGNTYSVSSDAGIAPGIAAYNLYVLHQPEWRPSYPNANLDVVTIGAADRAEYLVESKK
jgi:hypothetical protein